MKCSHVFLALSLMITSLTSCQQPIIHTTGPVTDSAPQSSANPSTQTAAQDISGYYFQLQELFAVKGFSTKAIEASHEVLLQESISAFLKDLEAGNTDDYYKAPEFSVQLFAGSEGGYFQSPDLIESFSNSLATYAQALVIYEDQSYDVFKGQYTDQKFYFNGADSLPEINTTYLINLDNELQPQVYTGTLLPFSVQAEATSDLSPESSPEPIAESTSVPEPTDSPPPKRPELNLFDPNNPPPPPDERFASALVAARRQARGYQADVRNLRLQPPPPPPPRPNEGNQGMFPPPPGENPPPNGDAPPLYPSPQLVDSLRESHPELAKDLEATMGLAPEEHAVRVWALYDANPEILPKPPVPRPPDQDHKTS